MHSLHRRITKRNDAAKNWFAHFTMRPCANKYCRLTAIAHRNRCRVWQAAGGAGRQSQGERPRTDVKEEHYLGAGPGAAAGDGRGAGAGPPMAVGMSHSTMLMLDGVAVHAWSNRARCA